MLRRSITLHASRSTSHPRSADRSKRPHLRHQRLQNTERQTTRSTAKPSIGRLLCITAALIFSYAPSLVVHSWRPGFTLTIVSIHSARCYMQALTICRALSISSHSNKFEAIPVLLEMQFRNTRKES